MIKMCIMLQWLTIIMKYLFKNNIYVYFEIDTSIAISIFLFLMN